MADGFETLLAGVATDTVAELARTAVVRRFASGTDMFRMGDRAGSVFRMLSGRAKVWRPLHDGQALTILYHPPETVVGLVGCCHKRPAPSTVTTVAATDVEVWPVATIHRLLEQDAVFASNALNLASDFVRLLIDKLEDSLQPAEQRIGRALLRLAGEHGRWRGGDAAVISVSRQDLADMTGATLFTASRTLSAWRRRGLIQSSRGRVVLTDRQAIMQIADLAA